MTRKLLATALVALALPLIPGCGTDGNVGYVRLVNATSAFATMDLYADGDSVLTGVASHAVSDYAKVDEGTRVLDVRNGGSGTTATTTTQTISTDHRYTLVAYYTGGAPTTQFLTEDEAKPSGANAKLRLLNGAASEVGSVDLYLTTSACNNLATSDVAVASAVSGLQDSFATFGAASGAGSQYNVCVTAAGSKTDLRLSTAITFTAGQVATLVVTATSGGVLLDGLLLNQQGTATAYTNSLARIRLVADAADGSSVSATFNGASVGSSSLSPSVLGYKTVLSGSAVPVITMNGIAVSAPTLTLEAGVDYTLLVAGTPGVPSITALTDDNAPSTNTNEPVKIRLVNGVNGITTAAAMTINGSPLINSVAFGEASAPVTTAAATSIPLVAYAGGTTLWSATGISLLTGTNYTVFLLGTTDNSATVSVLNTDN